MQLWVKLVPCLLFQTQGHYHFRSAATFIPGNRHHTDIGPDCGQRSRSTKASLIPNTDFDSHRLLREIRECLGAINPNAASVVEFNTTDDSVPACAEGV